jgi:hypothetical protein
VTPSPGLLRFLAVLFVAVAGKTSAQSSGETLTGRVFSDTLEESPISGAVVTLIRMKDGTQRVAITGARGGFSFTGLPVGKYRIVVTTTELEITGIEETDTVSIEQGERTSMIVALKSAREMVTDLCGATVNAKAAVAGRVLDGNEKPVVGARVTIDWLVGTETGRKLQSVDAITDSTGRIGTCNLPNVTQARYIVQVLGAKAIEGVVALRDSTLGTFLVRSPAAGTATGTGDSFRFSRVSRNPELTGALIRGTVFTGNGIPVRGARVSVEGITGRDVLTDSAGRFLLSSVTPGQRTVVVRALRFRPQRMTVFVAEHEEWSVSVVMGAAVLPDVTIAASTTGLDRVGFFHRRTIRKGGIFLTDEDIGRLGALEVGDILRDMQHLHVVDRGTMEEEIQGKGAYQGILWWVDGALVDVHSALNVQPNRSYYQNINQFVTADEIAGIEIYPPGEGDMRFTAIGNGCCQAIAIWTKDYVRRRAKDRK